MFGTISSTLTKEDILKHTTEAEILQHYLGISKIPCLICSPLRNEKKPSFGLFTRDGFSIFYKDFSTGESGNIYTLFKNLWSCSYSEVISRLYNDLKFFGKDITTYKSIKGSKIAVNKSTTDLDVIFRSWEDYDIEYWRTFGIELQWLKYADVYPISHIFFLRDKNRTLYKSEKYAYAFLEHKDCRTTIKVYQPFSSRFKWTNKHDASVISLWTKIPEKGEHIIICSSLKDALCVWSNTEIPCIALQGEGYLMSRTATKNLAKRYKNIYVLFDNDTPGIKGAKNLCQAVATNFSVEFKYLELPRINNQKDASDIYKLLKDKSQFKEIILNLINQSCKE